jgi:predicted RNase H-like nuclease (RuvC/YqgF family)
MIAKYRESGRDDRWYITNFTMEQVEGRIDLLEAENANLRTQLKKMKEQYDKEYLAQLNAEVDYKKEIAALELQLKEAQESSTSNWGQRERAEDAEAKCAAMEEQLDSLAKRYPTIVRLMESIK